MGVGRVMVTVRRMGVGGVTLRVPWPRFDRGRGAGGVEGGVPGE